MSSVSVRDLRNRGGEVLDRVARGESVIVTRDGAEVAELRPRMRPSLPAADLITSTVLLLGRIDDPGTLRRTEVTA